MIGKIAIKNLAVIFLSLNLHASDLSDHEGIYNSCHNSFEPCLRETTILNYLGIDDFLRLRIALQGAVGLNFPLLYRAMLNIWSREKVTLNLLRKSDDDSNCPQEKLFLEVPLSERSLNPIKRFLESLREFLPHKSHDIVLRGATQMSLAQIMPLLNRAGNQTFASSLTVLCMSCKGIECINELFLTQYMDILGGLRGGFCVESLRESLYRDMAQVHLLEGSQMSSALREKLQKFPQIKLYAQHLSFPFIVQSVFTISPTMNLIKAIQTEPISLNLGEVSNSYLLSIAENFPNTQVLTISGQEINKVDHLSKMMNLRKLSIWGTSLSSLWGMESLHHLEELEIWFCLNLKNIEALNSLPKLRYLKIISTSVLSEALVILQDKGVKVITLSS